MPVGLLRCSVAAHSRLFYGSRSIAQSFIPAQVSPLIQFSRRIFHVLFEPWHSQGLVTHCQAESQCRRDLGGEVAYRSINIESGRKYNLLTHCSASGFRGLSGARRIKYIHKQTQKCTHTHTHTYWSPQGSQPSELVWDFWWVGSTSRGKRITHLHPIYKREWIMATENNARSWIFLWPRLGSALLFVCLPAISCVPGGEGTVCVIRL